MDIKKVLIVDAIVLVVYALVANPAVTGMLIHEWLSIGALIVIVVHFAMHINYLRDVFSSAQRRRGIKLAKSILDALLIVVFMLCCISSIMVSGELLRALGLYASGYFFWDPLHAASAKLLLALLLVHVIANWKVVVGGLKKKRENEMPSDNSDC